MNPTLQKERDESLQTIANNNPELADGLMNALRYTNSPKRRDLTSVSGDDLETPVTPIRLRGTPEPQLPIGVNGRVNGVLGNIRSTSENARKLQEEQAAFASLVEQSSGFDIQNEQLERFGVTPERLSRLTDIELQLSDRAAESAITQSRIQNSAGQTLAQAGREITQEQREEAIRSAGLAAEAAVLQGNIETGRQLARDAVNIALQDREFQANAMIRQIEDLKSVVNEETRQLLVAEERTHKAELQKIADLKESIENAMINGASQSEMQFLTDPNTPDDVKLRTAQAITARGANQVRNLEIQKAQASIASSYASAAASRASAARSNAELDAMINPDPTAIPESTLQRLDDMSSGDKDAMNQARTTSAQIDRMIELINKNGDMALLTRATEDGREFLRLRTDVVDKLARDRTGAVVSPSEEGTFKDILGVGAFDIITKDKTEMINGLRDYQKVQQNIIDLRDPTGEVSTYLDAQELDADAAEAIDVQWGVTNNQDFNAANFF